MHHPVTTEFGKNKNYTSKLLDAILELNVKCLILWPNADSGSDEISKKIRIYRERGKLKNFRLKMQEDIKILQKRYKEIQS